MLRISRRNLLRSAGVAMLGALAASCQPKVVEVEKVVKETVVVKEEVEVQKEVTRVVEAPPAAPADKGPINLQWWSGAPLNPTLAQWEPYQKKAYEILADTIPGCTVTHSDMGWDAVLRQNLLTALMGGTAPDLIVGESFIQPDARIGAYLPLDDALKEAGIYDNLIPGVHQNAMADGKLYAISLQTGVFAFEENRKVVEKAGLDPDEWPATWGELLDRAAAITKAGNEEYYGYTLQGPVGYAVGAIMRVSVYSSIAGAPLCKEDCTYPWFDDPTLEKVFSFIREIHRYTPPGLSFNPDEPQVYHQLSRGVTAYQVAANWHVNYARENDAVDDVQYGLIPMPDDGGNFVSRTVGNTMALALSGTKHPQEAIEFLKILTMDDVTDFVYQCSPGRSPSTFTGLERTRPKIEPHHEVFFNTLRDGEVGCMPQWPKEATQVWGALNDMLIKLLTTEDRVLDLMAEAQQNAAAAIG
ncbi:MAG: ABC transporter substrate-binding protein [Anaerolineae bacterium]